MTRRDSGFTLVEIGVVVPILMLLAIAIFSIMYSYILSANREQARLYQSYSQTSAFDRLEADIRLSTAFLQTRDSATPDPYEAFSSGSTWNFAGTGTDNRVLLLREYATTNNPLSTIRKPVYRLGTGVTDCTDPADIAGPLTYDIVYFVQNTTLYRRILINPTSQTCGMQYQKLSCPDSDTLGNPTRDGSCGADDEVVATNVSDFGVAYYNDQGSATALDTDGSPSLVASAKSVNVTLANTNRTYNGSVSSGSSLRTTSQNGQSGGTN